MSVDCTDCPITPNLGRTFFSYKIRKAALRYEVGLGIQEGDIVWVSGGFAAGKYNDLAIFRMMLMGELEDGERV